MFCKQCIHGTPYGLFRHGNAWTLCVGTVTHERKNTLFTNLTKSLQIDTVTEYRCIIYLKVTGVYYNTCR